MPSSATLASELRIPALVLFWLCVATVVYTYAGYPLVLALLAPVFRRAAPQPSEEPTLTLLICAHNEEACIAAKLQDTLALRYPTPKLQILVASDGSNDGTNAIVRSFSSRGVELVQIDRQAGKTHAQNVAMSRARGDIVIFSDATTQYHPDALRFLAGNFTDPQVGAVSGCYSYLDPNHSSPNGVAAYAYSSYDNTIRRLQSQVWSISGCCGCIYSLRRALYTPLHADIISDLVQPLHVLRQGFRVTLEPRALAWESATVTTHREFSMRVRVVTRALIGLSSVHHMLVPWRHPWIALQIWSHKLLRWAVPVFLLGLLASSACMMHLPFYRAAFALQVFLYGVAAFTSLIPLHRRWRYLGLPLYFCTANAAAVGAFLQLMRGRRYAMWRPEREGSDARR